jgi:hypothetical protein
MVEKDSSKELRCQALIENIINLMIVGVFRSMNSTICWWLEMLIEIEVFMFVPWKHHSNQTIIASLALRKDFWQSTRTENKCIKKIKHQTRRDNTSIQLKLQNTIVPCCNNFPGMRSKSLS